MQKLEVLKEKTEELDARSFRRLAIEESVIVRRIGESDKDET